MKLDTWLVEGSLQIEHTLGCECARDRNGDMTMSLSGQHRVQASDDYMAEDIAVIEWCARHSDQVDKNCIVYFPHRPRILNVSQHEREQAALRAWNNGEPIRAEAQS